MTGYTPSPIDCSECGTAVIPNTPNELTTKIKGKWITRHYRCPVEELADGEYPAWLLRLDA